MGSILLFVGKDDASGNPPLSKEQPPVPLITLLSWEGYLLTRFDRLVDGLY